MLSYVLTQMKPHTRRGSMLSIPAGDGGKLNERHREKSEKVKKKLVTLVQTSREKKLRGSDFNETGTLN